MQLFMAHLMAFAAIATYITLGAFLLRFRSKRSPILIMLFASIPAYGIFPLFIANLDMVHYTGTYFFGAMCFLFFWVWLYKSISVRILCDLLTEENKSLCLDDIYEKYLLTESFKGRLQILIQSQYLTLQNNETYKLTLHGCKFVRRVGFIQRVYKITASG